MHTSLLQLCIREIALYASAEGKGTEKETAFFCDVSHHASRERGYPPVKCVGLLCPWIDRWLMIDDCVLFLYWTAEREIQLPTKSVHGVVGSS